MRTRFFLTSVFLILLMVGFANVKVDTHPNPGVFDRFSTEATSSDNGMIVKAIQYEGEIIPSIELPEVVITGERTNTKLTKAIVVDGKVVPMVELEEVVIRPSI